MDNQPNGSGYTKRPVWQWVLLYLVIALVAYGLVYYFVLAKHGATTYQAPDTSGVTTGQQPQVSPVSAEPASMPAQPTSQTVNVSTQAAAPSAPATPAPAATAPAASAPATLTAKSFTVNGNDASADLTSITVPKGTPVTITFGADAGSTYHGGLDFRSSVVSTGTIAPGSTKTVHFTATQSFAFTPYWPATNIAKPYQILVTVD